MEVQRLITTYPGFFGGFRRKMNSRGIRFSKSVKTKLTRHNRQSKFKRQGQQQLTIDWVMVFYLLDGSGVRLWRDGLYCVVTMNQKLLKLMKNFCCLITSQTKRFLEKKLKWGQRSSLGLGGRRGWFSVSAWTGVSLELGRVALITYFKQNALMNFMRFNDYDVN